VGDIVIRETDDTIALGFEPGVTLFVANVVNVMSGAIKLDYELAFDADEIGEEPADGMLTAEFQSVEATIPQDKPEELFGSSGLAAELTGMGVRVHFGMILAHSKVVSCLLFTPPHPNPLPHFVGERGHRSFSPLSSRSGERVRVRGLRAKTKGGSFDPPFAGTEGFSGRGLTLLRRRRVPAAAALSDPSRLARARGLG
jgi:hypothetical protein